MIFSSKSIEDILSGKKTMTRRLVKDGEDLVNKKYRKGLINDCVVKFNKKNNLSINGIKWRVGKSYAVQTGRGKKCFEVIGKELAYFNGYGKQEDIVFREKKPLLIKIIGIKKERLLDIDLTDARKEGFDHVLDFLIEFSKINKASKTFCNWLGNMMLTEKEDNYNPEVWVLTFEVEK